MELFVVLVAFSRYFNIGAMGVLNAPTEYYNIFKICAGDQIKYSKTVACNFSKDNLLHRLINHLNSSNDWICISYPVVQLEGEVGRSPLPFFFKSK